MSCRWWRMKIATGASNSRAHLSSKWAECGPKLLRENLWLFPSCKMPAFRETVVVRQLGICFLRPATWRCVNLVGEHADRCRDRNAFGSEEREFALPIQPSRRNRRICQPIEGNVVENVIT